MSTATPKGLLKTAFVPISSRYPTEPVPANTETLPIGVGNLSILVTANVAALRLVLVDNSKEPQDMTTLDELASVKDDASHLTQDDTVNDEEPVGRPDMMGLDTYDPLDTTRPTLGKDVELE